MIPVTGGHVDLSLLHPRFKERLNHFFADGRIANKVKVVSACRSYAAQKWLYDRYKAGKGNLAANPDWLRPDGFFRGSFHQEQPDGFSYAVDLRITKWNGISQKSVTEVARRYGIRPTVRGEWWHFQPRDADGWFPCNAYPDTKQADAKTDWDQITLAVTGVGRRIALSPLRRGSRGDDVRVVQNRLNALDFNCGNPDGVFGRKTRRAVKGLQRACLLVVDGVVGANSWVAMWKPEVPNGL
ncbi:hypothetical protein CMI48_05045 [Candidatus Pacearchaeota archaeon]|jgi:hypothetical protein|nr:hypothetical protein [Candidatus Pacearchaeota archaeon]|tara:strand:- start:380 stop:1102 length:723 start_codon:yes stop_codon:yes gene_type:complete